MLEKYKKNLKLFTLVFSLMNILNIFQLCEAKPIKVVTGSGYAPFTDEKIPKGGLATAIVSAVFKEVGEVALVFWKPWRRGYLEAQKGRFIGTFPYIKTTRRQEAFLYSDPIFSQSYLALSHISETKNYAYYQDLKSRILCRPVGYAMGDEATKTLDSMSMKFFRPLNMASCFKAITRLKKHVVVLNRLQAKAELKRMPHLNDEIKIHSLKENSFTLHFIVSKALPNAQHRIDQFNQGLMKVRKTGLIDKLSLEFGIEPFPRSAK